MISSARSELIIRADAATSGTRSSTAWNRPNVSTSSGTRSGAKP